MLISQYYNIGSIMVIFGFGVGVQLFNIVQDYDIWLCCLLGIFELFDQVIDNMCQGMKVGVVQLCDLMEKVLLQLDVVIKLIVEESIFWLLICIMLNIILVEDKVCISVEYKCMIELCIMLVYCVLCGFIVIEYLLVICVSSGLGVLFDGQVWYVNLIVQIIVSDQIVV